MDTTLRNNVADANNTSGDIEHGRDQAVNERGTPPEPRHGAGWTTRRLALAVAFAIVGWALCGAVIWIGSRFVSMNPILLVHAAAAPIIFASLSLLYFKQCGATSPLQTAILFVSVVIALDLFVVSLLMERNVDMFKSVVGTWLPFTLIFLATYVAGVFARKDEPVNKSGMIEAVSPTDRIRRSYNILSLGYGMILSPLEHKPRMLGLERAQIQPGDRVLEVAVGPGHSFSEILKKVDSANTVFGIDLSPKMLDKTRRRAKATGLANFDLREADARQLPFSNDTFDVLYNCYMLDLMPLNDIAIVLREFRRVLKPNGRLVLVNLSKTRADERVWVERLYQSLPKAWVPYLMGGCRPVLTEQPLTDAGFVEVHREFVAHVIPSEVVTAVKPSQGPRPKGEQPV